MLLHRLMPHARPNNTRGKVILMAVFFYRFTIIYIVLLRVEEDTNKYFIQKGGIRSLFL